MILTRKKSASVASEADGGSKWASSGECFSSSSPISALRCFMMLFQMNCLRRVVTTWVRGDTSPGGRRSRPSWRRRPWWLVWGGSREEWAWHFWPGLQPGWRRWSVDSRILRSRRTYRREDWSRLSRRAPPKTQGHSLRRATSRRGQRGRRRRRSRACCQWIARKRTWLVHIFYDG